MIKFFGLFNRDKKKVVYLGGPIGKGEQLWRPAFQDNARVHYINPETYYYDDVNELVETDVANIRKSDLIFCNAPVISPGTSMELVYAHMYNIPVILVIPKKILSPWHIYHCQHEGCHIVNTLKQGEKLLNNFLYNKVK